MSSARKAKRTAAPARTRKDPESATGCYPNGESASAPPLPVDRDDLAYYVRHHLTQTERMVIMLHYAEELELEEIASVLKMAQAEIEEIHQSVVGRLKNALTSCEALATV